MIVDKYAPEKRSKSPEIRIHKQKNDDDDDKRSLRLSKDKTPSRDLSSPRRSKTPEIRISHDEINRNSGLIREKTPTREIYSLQQRSKSPQINNPQLITNIQNTFDLNLKKSGLIRENSPPEYDLPVEKCAKSLRSTLNEIEIYPVDKRLIQKSSMKLDSLGEFSLIISLS